MYPKDTDDPPILLAGFSLKGDAMSVTRDVVVVGAHVASDYVDGKHVATREVSVHFGLEGETSMSSMGSSVSATVTLSPEEAAQWPVGTKAALTIEASLERG